MHGANNVKKLKVSKRHKASGTKQTVYIGLNSNCKTSFFISLWKNAVKVNEL
jgi:hypothetical protein